MTKKHFIELADYLRGSKPVGYQKQGSIGGISATYGAEMEQWERDVQAVIDFCKAQNGNFDRSIFIGYINGDCGPSGGTIKKSKVA